MGIDRDASAPGVHEELCQSEVEPEGGRLSREGGLILLPPEPPPLVH